MGGRIRFLGGHGKLFVILHYSGNTNFVCNSEVVENICEGDRKVKSAMGPCNFNDIKQERNWYAFMLEVYRDRH